MWTLRSLLGFMEQPSSKRVSQNHKNNTVVSDVFMLAPQQSLYKTIKRLQRLLLNNDSDNMISWKCLYWLLAVLLPFLVIKWVLTGSAKQVHWGLVFSCLTMPCTFLHFTLDWSSPQWKPGQLATRLSFKGLSCSKDVMKGLSVRVEREGVFITCTYLHYLALDESISVLLGADVVCGTRV